jgi:integrase
MLALGVPNCFLKLKVDDYYHNGARPPVGCHTWRATGVTIYLENDGRLNHAQQMAGHESPRTTKLYDRTNYALP